MELIPEYHIAQKRLRIMAFIIDYIIFAFTALVIFLLLFDQNASNKTDGYWLLRNVFSIIFIFSSALIFWPISEGLFGKTIGKRLLKIKVVTDENQPIGILRALARFLIAIIDLQMLIGLLVASLNKKNKRIGDNIAGTIVVLDN